MHCSTSGGTSCRYILFAFSSVSASEAALRVGLEHLLFQPVEIPV